MRIEHVQPLRHVVERGGKATVLLQGAPQSAWSDPQQSMAGKRTCRPEKRIPPAILCRSDCDIVNLCFPFLSAKTANFAAYEASSSRGPQSRGSRLPRPREVNAFARLIGP